MNLKSNRIDRRIVSIISVAILVIVFTGIVHPASATSPTLTEVRKAIVTGTTSISFRSRYEGVERDGISKDANGLTVRSRLSYRTNRVSHLRAFVQLEDVTALGGQSFNSIANGKTRYPVIADAEVTEVNQAYIQYEGPNETDFRWGRQQINRGNQRFIGGVGWRQNEQTYDAVTLRGEYKHNWDVFYGYVYNVNRIFNAEKSTARQEDLDSQSSLVNLSYENVHFGNLNGSVTGYGYYLDFNNLASSSNRTLGVRFRGRYPIYSYYANVVFDWANQTDYGANTLNYDENYGLVEWEVTDPEQSRSILLGYEILGGNASLPGAEFQTPLATLHAFQGWTDQFTNTPSAGIEDLYAKIKKDVSYGSWSLNYHDFESESGSTNYGSEYGIRFHRSLNDYTDLTAKYARYEADQFSRDTEKIWVMMGNYFRVN